jgi:hypothetical protein
MTQEDPRQQQATIRTLEAQLEAARAELREAQLAAGREGDPSSLPFMRRHWSAMVALAAMLPLFAVLAVMQHRATARAERCMARLSSRGTPPGPPPSFPATTDDERPTPPTPPPPPASADSVGVKECDEYIAKYTRCVEKRIPAAQQQLMQRSLRQMRDAWRKAAQTEGGRRALAQACKTAMKTARKTMASFNCEW